MEEINVSFECEVIIYFVHPRYLSDLERLTFEPPQRMVKL